MSKRRKMNKTTTTLFSSKQVMAIGVSAAIFITLVTLLFQPTVVSWIDSWRRGRGLLDPSPAPTNTPTPNPYVQAGLLSGFSGYPRNGFSDLDLIIANLIKYGCDTYRISFTPTWTTGSRPYRPDYVDYFLANTPSNFKIIIDTNHHTSNDVVDWTQAQASVLAVAARWPNNPCVFIEVINEYANSDYYSKAQTIITAVRNAGYTNPLVSNKHSAAQAWQRFNDPLDNTYQGFHFYMNQYTPAQIQSMMLAAKNAGITKIVNTEVGADYRETQYFTQASVDALNEFLMWSLENGIGNNVWLNSGIYNLNRYEYFGGLDFGV